MPRARYLYAMRRCLLYIVLLLPALFFKACPALASGHVYLYTANCSNAYQMLMALHFDEAEALLRREALANPTNLMVAYLSDYDDCLRLLIHCNRQDYDLRKANLDSRINTLELGDRNSPWYRFCLAGVNLRWAMISFQLGDKLKSATRFRRAFALLNDNERLYPNFEYNIVYSGLRQAVVGSLPGSYKWLASIFGLKGDVKTGIGQLERFVNTHTELQPMYHEARLYYLFTRFYIGGRQQEVWDFVNSPVFAERDNLLQAYVKATIGLDYRKAEFVTETLKAASRAPHFADFPVFDYQMGIALLTRLDMSCVGSFQEYLRKTKGDVYIKDCWQKMAFAWYITGNRKQAEYCRRQAGISGSARLDVDKQAQKFAVGIVWPLQPLLQSRLLIEGGYYSRALALLNGIDKAQLNTPAARAEYYFRLGRAYQETGVFIKALENFDLSVNAGKGRPEQFAARAALHMGLIFEQTGLKPQAITKYKECLAMPEHDFQNSIDQQAKAGLERLQTK